MRAALSSANAHAPKGAIQDHGQNFQIYTNDQASKAQEYQPLIVAYRNGAAVRLSDVADVTDSVENLRNFGLANGAPAVLVLVFRSPGANIISTIDSVTATLPQLEASIPSDIHLTVVTDRSTTIRASLHDVERTLTIAIVLVIVVVFLFLRDPRAGLIPTVAVPVSLLGTIAFMWLLGFSLDNLSLMALTISTGFVVDDAIVVLENIMRHVEAGMSRLQATLLGAREVGFTVLSMSVSLVAVFIPILLMGGVIGRLFREFALTLSIAIMVSLAISLTTTPMMCALFLRRPKSVAEGEGRFGRILERGFGAVHRSYERSLAWALEHARTVMLILLGTVCLNVFLFIIVPKGFFPQQDTGRLIGGLQADQSISFQLMRAKLTQMMSIVEKDPAVASIAGFTGGGQTNFGMVFVTLKPLSERHVSADGVIARLRRALGQVPGASLFLQSVQDIRVGGRQSNAQYQYTMQGDDLDELYTWVPKIVAALQKLPELTEVNSDFQQKGLETDLKIDRGTAARLGLTVSQIDNTLYDAFGQRQVSTIFNPLNQYHVVMEVDPRYWQDPSIAQGYLHQHRRRGQLGAVDQRACRHNGDGGERAGPQPGRGPQPADQRADDDRPHQRLDRRGGEHQRRAHGAALRGELLRPRHHAALGQSPGAGGRVHDLLQPRPGRLAQRRHGGRRQRDPAARRPDHDPRQVPRHGAGLSSIAAQRAGHDPGGAAHDLYRARRAL